MLTSKFINIFFITYFNTKFVIAKFYGYFGINEKIYISIQNLL
ncbi:hypothetical protein CHAB381_0390 [Campylobacter hominis ATCC BAA-381]|uniref:Uncharacterized protein n=1 Tax=Campylobacter hominis (strain ATCC BAA-381 / DSM 21671 / CCUG 45161 / LMG 19568 / NCTC 13146 / CH001A) TaxID=360107 RepID=A7I0E9_CAMHC|nr:hypothetical protein CHAB381_0390 [Campylobacter hominis ATCC BAA-381]